MGQDRAGQTATEPLAGQWSCPADGSSSGDARSGARGRCSRWGSTSRWVRPSTSSIASCSTPSEDSSLRVDYLAVRCGALRHGPTSMAELVDPPIGAISADAEGDRGHRRSRIGEGAHMDAGERARWITGASSGTAHFASVCAARAQPILISPHAPASKRARASFSAPMAFACGISSIRPRLPGPDGCVSHAEAGIEVGISSTTRWVSVPQHGFETELCMMQLNMTSWSS